MVILGFIEHDLLRSMSLYGFLLFHMRDMPFPKPRFIVEGEQLSGSIPPLISMGEIWTMQPIQDLRGYSFSLRVISHQSLLYPA